MSDEQSNDESMELEEFTDENSSGTNDEPTNEGPTQVEDLEAVFDVPVRICAILGRTNMEISNLLELDEGDIIELDRKVGEAIDLYVNNRLVARGEVVLVDEKLGVTMTEIIANSKSTAQ